MKKFNLSIVTVMAMSTFAIAGGDIAPVEPVVVYEEPVVEDKGFYLGLGFGWLSAEREVDVAGVRVAVGSDDYTQYMLQAGYKFNSYVTLEGRYWGAIDDSSFIYDNIQRTAEVDAWGIYVKPMYPVTHAFDIYATHFLDMHQLTTLLQMDHLVILMDSLGDLVYHMNSVITFLFI